MITIECGSLKGCSKLEEIKTIKKLRMIQEPIRINKNIAKSLSQCGYIISHDTLPTYSTYSLTSKGIKTPLIYESFDLTLDAYLRIKNIQAWLSRLIHKRKENFVFKIMITTCFSCGTEFKRHDLEHVQDTNNNDGMYCKSCLKRGYQYALSQLRERRDVICGSKASRCTSSDATINENGTI
jgi:hypothetical protein